MEVGDRVLVRNLSERGGPGKLRAYWEDKIHIVIRRLSSDSPVYEVKPEKSDGRSRTLHRTLLLPCDYLELDCETRDKTSHVQKSPSLQHRMANKQQDYLDDGSDGTEAEDNFPLFTPNEIPHLKDEIGHATTDQQGSLELDMDPDTDTALFEENREASQSFQTSNQSLDQSQSETDDRGSNPDTIADSSEPEERPGLTHSPDASQPSPMEPRRPTRTRQPPSRLVYNDLGNPDSEQQFYVNSSFVQPNNIPLQTRLSASAPTFVPCRYVNVPVPLYHSITPGHQNIRQFVPPQPYFNPYFRAVAI